MLEVIQIVGVLIVIGIGSFILVGLGASIYFVAFESDRALERVEALEKAVKKGKKK